MPLTDTMLRAIKPTGKTQKLFDGKGIYLEVTSKGATYWGHKYRIDGKENRLSYGVYPDVSLKVAREQGAEARKLVAKGIDPSAVCKAAKTSRLEDGANTFEVIAREWFARQSPDWAEAYSSKVIRRLEMYVFPWLGKKPIATTQRLTILPAIAHVQRVQRLSWLCTRRRSTSPRPQVCRAQTVRS